MRRAVIAFMATASMLVVSGRAHSSIVDRIVVTVDRDVITAAQVEEEVIVTEFIEHQPLDITLEKRRQAADHLVEQLLVMREMELSRYPKPTDADSVAYLAQLVNSYGGEAAFNAALARYSLNDQRLKQHLAFQITILRFLDYRFRPDVDVTDAEMQAAYEKEVANWRQKNKGEPPTLEQSRDALKKKIFDDDVENSFSTWLEETRKLVKVTYLQVELQ
jgi:hypothetical protein